MKRLLIAALTAALWTSPALADKAERYWPQWRGPLGNGVAPHGDPPLTWSEAENVRFKVPIPGRGLASPIVWGKRIFLLTTVAADAGGRIYVVSREGSTTVFQHGDRLEVLATNQLDDGFEASPAIVDDEIYLRGRKYLYAISQSPRLRKP